MSALYPGKDPPPPASAGSAAANVGAAPAADAPGPFVMSCDSLEGDRVVNRANDELGTLEHFMVDVPTGRIAYAVLASGGVFGIGERLFAIPWSALTLDAERHCFVLDMERSRLETAAGFDQDHWPSMTDAKWAAGVHEFFGVTPYWRASGRLQ